MIKLIKFIMTGVERELKRRKEWRVAIRGDKWKEDRSFRKERKAVKDDMMKIAVS